MKLRLKSQLLSIMKGSFGKYFGHGSSDKKDILHEKKEDFQGRKEEGKQSIRKKLVFENEKSY